MAHKSIFINGIVTPKGRFAFPHLAKPDTEGQYADDKYKVTILIPKTEDIRPLQKAIMDCARQAWPKKRLKPKDLAHIPLRDGDEKVREAVENDKSPLEGYEGAWFITAKSKKRRRTVDAGRNDIDPEECYGGAYGRLVLTAMSYEQAGKPGVTFLLDVVQKIADGEAFGGGGGNTDVLDDGLYDEQSAKKKGGADADADDWGDGGDGPESEDPDADPWN